MQRSRRSKTSEKEVGEKMVDGNPLGAYENARVLDIRVTPATPKGHLPATVEMIYKSPNQYYYTHRYAEDSTPLTTLSSPFVEDFQALYLDYTGRDIDLLKLETEVAR